MSTEKTAEQRDQVIAEGVDEDPIEGNRRLFTGRAYLTIATLATVYAAFHMLALNGVSISDWTGIELPFLPQFPMETWNFRIVHIAGALGLGFLLFSAHTFHPDRPHKDTRLVTLVAAALVVPALVAGAAAIGFVQDINSGELPQMGGLTTWASFPGTETYEAEVRRFGIPLLIATFGAIATGWFERRGRELFAASDIVLALCGIVMAIYLVAIYGTAARNSVGTPFVPIGVAFAATAGSAMILELTRRVAGARAPLIITGVFLVYNLHRAIFLPGILAVQQPFTWQRFFGFVYTDRGHPGARPPAVFLDLHHPLHHLFAAFLQASKVGDYFVNFAFAAAGRRAGRRPGPKGWRSSPPGLDGHDQTYRARPSAGNVCRPRASLSPSAGWRSSATRRRPPAAIEAAHRPAGQIMPPIMGRAGLHHCRDHSEFPTRRSRLPRSFFPRSSIFVSILLHVWISRRQARHARHARGRACPKFRRDGAQGSSCFLPIVIPDRAPLFMGYLGDPAPGTLATVARLSWSVGARPEHFSLHAGGRWDAAKASGAGHSRRCRSGFSFSTCCRPWSRQGRIRPAAITNLALICAGPRRWW